MRATLAPTTTPFGATGPTTALATHLAAMEPKSGPGFASTAQTQNSVPEIHRKPGLAIWPPASGDVQLLSTQRMTEERLAVSTSRGT